MLFKKFESGGFLSGGACDFIAELSEQMKGLMFLVCAAGV